MEVILSKLREGGVDMDMVTLAYYIDDLRDRSVYSDMSARVQLCRKWESFLVL
jgi:hypothetical protein